ncbi:dolichyl-phosphate beta-glucosyltransferase [Folsomia candida]|nr:dolichyl-phosphate beta-glucosyltransferase [Folsomia candida]
MDLSGALNLIGLLIGVGVVLVAGFLVVLGMVLRRGNPYPVVKRYPEEESFTDPVNKKKSKFPSLEDKAALTCSVIVPAYFEEERLPPMLEECLHFLEQKSKTNSDFSYEVIIVSDGSTDGTVNVALDYAKKFSVDKVRLLDLIKNRGKGGAVRLGVLSSRGKCILFADADGATKFADYDKLYKALIDLMKQDKYSGDVEQFQGIVCGSRAHMEEEAIATRSIFRTILMRGFHLLVYILTVRGIRDTQCGFKLFTRAAARKCFSNLHIERWAFDVELLCIAQALKIPIAEVGVNWTEIEGSKVTPILSWLQMGRDLFLIWFHYAIGAWKLIKKSD